MSDAVIVETRSRAFVRDLIALTKPRIISLLLVTTIAPMFVAGSPSWPVGARGVRRRVSDGRRRQRREHVHGPRHRRSHVAHTLASDPQRPDAAARKCWRSASCCRRPQRGCWRRRRMCSRRHSRSRAFYFYVFIYTRWLKRSTPQNIVIGGAAGAFPHPWSVGGGHESRWICWRSISFLIVFY